MLRLGRFLRVGEHPPLRSSLWSEVVPVKAAGSTNPRKKLGLTLISEKAGAERAYRVPAGPPSKSKPKIAAQAAA
jgi:hypothetical protein